MGCTSTLLYLFATDNTINKSKVKPTTKMKVLVAEFLLNQTILFHRKDSVVKDLCWKVKWTQTNKQIHD